MITSIDTIIFSGFLVANIVLGLISSKGVKTIKEYAVGNGNFSTATIVATIVATWISGSYFFNYITESYKNGLYFIWIALIGDPLCLLLIGWYFAPRMGEFLGKLSIAEAMGSLYGKEVRIITAISGFIGSCGMIALQLKVSGIVFEYCFGINGQYSIIISCIIITFYSALGGIKSVTFTDIIQFITFSIIIPIVIYYILKNIESIELIKSTIYNNDSFNFKKVFNFSEQKSFYQLFIFIWMVLPSFNPAIFQRIAMAKNINQVTRSFVISGIICFILGLMMCFIGVAILAKSTETIHDYSIIKYIIDDNIIGLKGMVLVCITAMVMSTADSYINSTSVLVVHDFLKIIKPSIVKHELYFTKVTSIFVGFFSIILTLHTGSLLELVIYTSQFYLPIVTVPFILSILGFRSTKISVLLGMFSGLIFVLFLDYTKLINISPSIPGMLVNFVVLISSHYLLKQSGGWVGIKDKKVLIIIRTQRKEQLKKIIREFKEFNIIEVCKRNCPNGEGLISVLGLFVMIVTFSSVNNLSIKFHNQYSYLLDILYPLTLCTSSALISYPLWLQQWKDSRFIAVIWNFIMFSVLICFNFLIVLISNFAEIQLIVFMINIVVVVSLIRWKWALFNIVLGVSLTAILYNHYYVNLDLLDNNILTSQFKIVYLMLLTASSLVLFLKPKQQYQELTEDSNLFLSSKVEDQKHELSRLHELKNEFLRNLEHEAHTPITGITSMGQVLWENYDKFSETQRRKATKEIAKSSERLNSLVNNLIDLSKLENLNYRLNKTTVNLTDLVYERVEICQKLYIEEKDKENLNFDLKIEDKLTVLCDEYYIARTIDNIVINAIQYCKKGTIAITLKSTKNHTVEFSVGDEGIGIPKDELLDIFDPFTVSSKTKTPSGGRGIGLTLCKKVVTAHGGTITASSENKGSLFRVILPK
jgi:Na+/proline symporter/signal transduction histidine kinase